MKSKLGQVNKDVVLITGVSSGIGHQLVNRFLNDGYVVIAIGRQIDQPPFNVKEEYLENLVYIPFDYSDYEILIGTLKTYLSRASIGILVNNAGMLNKKPADDVVEEDLIESFRINAIVPFIITKSLKQAGLFMENAHVINISSMAGIVGGGKYPGLLSYSSSKAALNAVTESMQAEWGDVLSVNALALGAVNTQMFRDAFFEGQAEISDVQMADWISDFALNSGHLFAGQVIQVKKNNPF
jgi:3-oxoacyl-[acyl-carrier protein] reductase